MGQVIASGVQVGSSYALLALALVLVLKSTNVPNFAQAEMGLLPAFVTWQVMTSFHVPYAVGILAGVATGIVLAIVLERVLIRPILRASHFALVMMTIGIFFTLNSFDGIVWGSSPRVINAPFSGNFKIAGTVITDEQVVAFALGIAIMLALRWFFSTRRGVQMRALAEDRETPRLLGVRVNRVFVAAWAIAGTISAIAVILATQATVLNDQSGQTLIIDGFVAATLGGFSSITGAFVGGIILGVLENLAGTYISTSAASALALIAVFAVLIVRPTGLFGQAGLREV